jgi:hypothetical protein
VGTPAAGLGAGVQERNVILLDGVVITPARADSAFVVLWFLVYRPLPRFFAFDPLTVVRDQSRAEQVQGPRQLRSRRVLRLHPFTGKREPCPSCPTVQPFGHVADRGNVTIDAHAGNHGVYRGGDHRHPTPLLPPAYVRYVNLDLRYI